MPFNIFDLLFKNKQTENNSIEDEEFEDEIEI